MFANLRGVLFLPILKEFNFCVCDLTYEQKFKLDNQTKKKTFFRILGSISILDMSIRPSDILDFDRVIHDYSFQRVIIDWNFPAQTPYLKLCAEVNQLFALLRKFPSLRNRKSKVFFFDGSNFQDVFDELARYKKAKNESQKEIPSQENITKYKNAANELLFGLTIPPEQSLCDMLFSDLPSTEATVSDYYITAVKLQMISSTKPSSTSIEEFILTAFEHCLTSEKLWLEDLITFYFYHKTVSKKISQRIVNSKEESKEKKIFKGADIAQRGNIIEFMFGKQNETYPLLNETSKFSMLCECFAIDLDSLFSGTNTPVFGISQIHSKKLQRCDSSMNLNFFFFALHCLISLFSVILTLVYTFYLE